VETSYPSHDEPLSARVPSAAAARVIGFWQGWGRILLQLKLLNAQKENFLAKPPKKEKLWRP
jgi:hypothetical protein